MPATWPTLSRHLVAILRGVQPSEIADIGGALVQAGFEAIEVPLNSPDAFASIALLARTYPSLLIGAGTVLTADEVDRLHAAGGRLMVSPNIDRDVMLRAQHHGLVTMPGVFTATEALLASSLGASALKFFPAHILGAKGIAAIRTILPAHSIIGAVGGIDEAQFTAFMREGIRLFGLGTSLYRPGSTAADVSIRARSAIEAYDKARAITSHEP